MHVQDLFSNFCHLYLLWISLVYNICRLKYNFEFLLALFRPNGIDKVTSLKCANVLEDVLHKLSLHNITYDTNSLIEQQHGQVSY